MSTNKGQISNFEEQENSNQFNSSASSKASTNDTSTNGSNSDVEDLDMTKDATIPSLTKAPKSHFLDSCSGHGRDHHHLQYRHIHTHNCVRTTIPPLARQMTYHATDKCDDFSSYSASAEATRPQKKRFNNKEERFEFN